VIDAVDLRLRDFRTSDHSDAELSIEFVAGDDTTGRAAPPPGSGRPVYDTPHGTLYYHPTVDALCGRLGRVALHCDASRGTAVQHSPGFTGRELYLATHPLTTIAMMELFERRGLFSLHAACLTPAESRGVLIAGPSGSGKSTLTIALARAGMSFLSDDVVFLEPDCDGVRVLGFADTLGLTGYAAARFAELGPLMDEPPADGFPKRLHRIEDLFGAATLRACRPTALVFPEVEPRGRSAIAPLDPGEALIRLTPDVLLTEPVSTKAHLEAIAALLGQVRCYTLRSGRDLERAAELVRAAA
jgi:hypothetical protein